MSPDPSRHASNRNWFESILRYVPGFRGYLEKEYRRESDYLARTWMADRLQRSKVGLDDFMRALVDAANLDVLPPCERLRSKLDGLISRIRSAVRGYSGIFDFDGFVGNIVLKFGESCMTSVLGLLVKEEMERLHFSDEQKMIAQSPLLSYLAYGRFTEIKDSFEFPFPKDFVN